MSSFLENYFPWTGSFVEAFQGSVCDVANAILTSFNSITSNPSTEEVEKESNDVPAPTVPTVESGEKASQPSNLPRLLEDIASFFEADEFQLLLLKVFIGILLTNIFLIYVAWYIYGERITETFMTPKETPEELKKKIEKLNLPRDHSERM